MDKRKEMQIGRTELRTDGNNTGDDMEIYDMGPFSYADKV